MDDILCTRNRYLVPFLFKENGRETFDEIVTRISAMPAWELQDMTRHEYEQDLYDMILNAFQKNADQSNIGCSFIYKKTGETFPKLSYSTKGEKIRFHISEAGMFLFRTGIGFFWYEVKFDDTITIDQLISFQNQFKELACRNYLTPIKGLGCCVFETDDDARQPFLMGYQIHENILGKLQLQKWLYFASRPYTVDAQTEIQIPDKALLFNYVVFPQEMKEQTEEIYDRIFCLTSGYNRRYKRKSDFSSGLYEPFDKAYCYATAGGCGYYAIVQADNWNFYTRVLFHKIMTDYFLMYVLAIYQSDTLLKYSHDIEQDFPAELSAYEKEPHEILKLLKDMETKINVFLVKSVYASVSNINHHNNFYLYLVKKLKIKANIDSLTAGLHALQNLQQMRESEELEEKTEREERQRKVVEDRLSLVLGLISIMALLSAIADGKAAVDLCVELFGWSGKVGTYLDLGIVFVTFGLAFVTAIILIKFGIGLWGKKDRKQKKKRKEKNSKMNEKRA